MSQTLGPGGNAPRYQQPAPNDGVATIIPYRNGFALASYYLGVFSILPCVGLLLGIAAVICGILGLKAVKKNPHAKGKGHAIAGIILGGLFGLAWLVVSVGFLILVLSEPVRRP